MKILLLILFVVFSYVAYEFIRVSALVATGKRLVIESKAFSRADGEHTMLALGDSTAASVGSVPALSVPGRLSMLIDASVENLSKSGAHTRHMHEQFANARLGKYDLILIQAGANDVIFFGTPKEAERELDMLLQVVREKSDHVLLITAGDIGEAPIFPWPVNHIISARTRDLRERFLRIAAKHDVVYVDIYSHPDPFGANPSQYYAPDMLHLSGEGYGFWFGIVKEYVKKEWPELVATHP